jgi:hypothetical protein
MARIGHRRLAGWPRSRDPDVTHPFPDALEARSRGCYSGRHAARLHSSMTAHTCRVVRARKRISDVRWLVRCLAPASQTMC